MLDHRRSKLVAALRRLPGAAAVQGHLQVAGAERVAPRSGIHHALRRQRDRRHLKPLPLQIEHQTGIRAAFDNDLAYAERLRARHYLFNRLLAPQQFFVIQRQKGDVGAGQHLAVGLLSFLTAWPQTRAVVVVEDHLFSVGATAAQQRQQLRAVGRREDRKANAAEVQVIELRQPRAQCVGLRSSKPIAGGGVIAPIVESAFAGGVGFDHVQARQLVVELLNQPGLDLLLPPGHLAAEAVGAERSDVIHLQRLFRHLAGEVYGGVEGIAAKAARQLCALL
uniref:Uncharacterized protein n=1 Tax=Serratia marcescens TaxID=615 RepID=Q2Q5S8_SERMA|nr:unknown [Serratia marcescens]